MKDIIIIGGGVVGCAIARELSRYETKILLLEKGNDVSVGASKANSGIVHGGYDAEPNSKKAFFNVKANGMFDKLSKELDFPFKHNGSMVLCFSEDGLPDLHKLLNRGVQNGVKGLEIVDGERAREIEPNLSKNVVAALIAPSGGIVSPYEMTIAYAENAYTNGAEFEFCKEVTAIEKTTKGFSVVCADGSVYNSKFVINCAGVYADKINNMICAEKLEITARKGEYVLMDKTCSYLTEHTLFQQPTKMGKGVLVTPTTHGNILVGPSATDITDKDDVDTTMDVLNMVFEKGSVTVPTLSRRNIITQFAGLRAHDEGDDFIVGESKQKGFYNVAGIESPGLTSAPAIAVYVAKDVAKKMKLNRKIDFVPKRKGIPQFSHLTDKERKKLIKENALFGKIVCRCEVVTEAEIVMAINRPLGAKDLDGVKRRTRAGMGRCQAGFCTSRVMEILSRETGKSYDEITKCGGVSKLVFGRTK